MGQGEKNKRGCLFIGMVILCTMVVTVGVTYWVMTQYVFKTRFDPVRLSSSEQRELDRKLSIFEGLGTKESDTSSNAGTSGGNRLQPEKYSEEGADRRIALTERELNGMLASHTDMAKRFAIDLSDNLASGKLLIPLDPDFPVMGGKTLRLNAGMELAFRDDRPIVKLRGVSIMGVPVPNAWLGGFKNVDLVREFGGDDGFWKAFAEGVEYISVAEGRLVIQLLE